MDDGLCAKIDGLTPAQVHAIVGPMFSGKTLTGLQRIEKHEYGIRSVLKGGTRDHSEFTVVFKPKTDDRSGEYVFTHAGGNQRKGIIIDPSEPERMLEPEFSERRIILYDEVQFSAPHITDVFEELRRQGRYVIASGLDLDFLGEPFPVTSRVMAYADKVEKITAHCMYEGCGHSASRTQLLYDGVPVRRADSNVVIQGKDDRTLFQARCLEHYVDSRG